VIGGDTSGIDEAIAGLQEPAADPDDNPENRDT
jgi:hypothetical protein